MTNNKFFKIKESFKEEEIDTAIENTIQDVSKEKCDSTKIRKDSIIVHGIHQFTPIMLKMIEELSKYKLVVILFNYQVDYKMYIKHGWMCILRLNQKLFFHPKI